MMRSTNKEQLLFYFFQAEDGIRDIGVTGVQTCALPIFGLSIELYQPFRDLDSTDPHRFARNLRRAERKFDVMAALGVDTVLVCSSVSPDAVNDPDLLAGQLGTAAARAGERGLRIAYEALAWSRHVSTWERSWDAVRRADSPALGLCLDSFHVLSRDRKSVV